jgi:site-specific DNA recombinase
LDTMVVSHLEERLLAPERLEELLAGLLKRREEHAGRLKGQIAELRKQAADAEAKLTRLYEAIENGLAEMDDSNLKGRIVELKRIRDAARADADRAENRGEGGDNRVTPELLRRFGVEARKKIRDREGGFRRHHLQALNRRGNLRLGGESSNARGNHQRRQHLPVANKLRGP